MFYAISFFKISRTAISLYAASNCRGVQGFFFALNHRRINSRNSLRRARIAVRVGLTIKSSKFGSARAAVLLGKVNASADFPAASKERS